MNKISPFSSTGLLTRRQRYHSVLAVLVGLLFLLWFYLQPLNDLSLLNPGGRSVTVTTGSGFRLAGFSKVGNVQRTRAVNGIKLAAFPGAKGDGAGSRGGRGGRVLIVDRLDDPCPTKACSTEDLASAKLATPGTLRWALLQDFPRTVVFRVSGVLRLQEDIQAQVDGQVHVKRLGQIRVKHPYLTIAGQTAPAGGITIAGNGISIETHDVIMRYLRFRTGRGEQPFYHDQQNPETLAIGNGARDIVIDHCSFSWMPSEGVSVYTGESDDTTGTAGNVTLSWNIIGEGLIQHEDGRGHPSGAFMSGFDGDSQYAARDITLHHNLLLHTQKRNGDLLSYNGRLVNNLFYNWQWLPTVIAGGIQADIIGNIWRPGPMSDTKADGTRIIHLVPAASALTGEEADDWWRAVPGAPSLFLSGNAFENTRRVLLNQQDLICHYRTRNEACQEQVLESRWFRNTALSDAGYNIDADPVHVAERKVLEQAGASQRVNLAGKWVANRDTVDERFVSEYRDMTYGKKRFPWHEKEVGGYPPQIEGAAYPDKDRDGMSDIWESANDLDPKDAGDAALVAKEGSGYTNLEWFINGEK